MYSREGKGWVSCDLLSINGNKFLSRYFICTFAVAFSELRGFGFRPYEFLPSAFGSNVTAAREQESMLGMFALRSFIYPRIYTVVGYIALIFGYNGSFYMVRFSMVKKNIQYE